MNKQSNNSTQDTLNQYFLYVSENNIDGIISLLADDIDWYIAKSEQLSWTGRLDNKSEIAKALQMIFDAHVEQTARFDVDHIFIDGGEAAVFGMISRQVKATGKTFTASVCQRFTITEGKITRLLMLEDASEILKAF
ncbi:nuclear transport factor 2 family protein [Pedobacter sp. V48]|uniref:nuclear transport factor 2 family protein n=1 Tax=Pedobacter sp. V48 TaxID=509635 RepID=UPI0003E5264C|nr:nuclear transport factor 2 family protein [Pedobacter sp. V48]ETZ20968.1 hypothetical protein N824_02325 [Pedobacter sp. V48]